MIGSDEKVERIKKIAFKFFLETGYEATTIRMICKAAEIEAPTLYYFFESKKGLFLTIRNEMEEEYRDQVIELNLDNEETPQEALKKYYKFCIQYTMNNPDKTRFYLRHHLFRPIELRDEIQERIQATTEGKLKLYGKYLEESIARGEIVSTKEDAFRQYTSFIDNITFNMIFSGWKPSDEEIDKAWNLFYNNYLKE